MPRAERPLDGGNAVLTRFAAELRKLRIHAGSPTYRELARRVHYSVSSLADAAGGQKLPSLPVTMAYVRGCGGDVVEWENRWRATADELESRSSADPDDGAAPAGRSPYVGLTAYGPEDAEWFHGRERVVAVLTERVARQRFVAVVGASGSGKSSVLRAGLIPALSADGDRWTTLVITPGARPLEECAVRVGARSGIAAGQLAEDLRGSSRNLGLAIRQLMAPRPEGAEFLLVVDQFEEIFTLCHDTRERDQFIAAILDAAHDQDSRTRVVVGLRSDFYTHCARQALLVEALQDAQVLIGPMSAGELTEAITQPALRAGLMVEKALVATVVHDAAERPGALPFVSHALRETWHRRRGNGLFLSGYQAAGGVNGAIAKTADRLYGDLDDERQQVARSIFLRLTALGEGTEDTRRRASQEELLDNPHRDVVATVMDRLVAARLVVLDAGTVEIAHEALIRGWPALREWLAEDRETLRAHRQLTEATAEWERHERDEGLLYRGARLTAWQDRPVDTLNATERAFLAASRRGADREQRLRRRRVHVVIGGLGAATAVVAVLAVIAMVLAGQAEHERSLAVGRQLLADARAQLPVDPELGLLLAREAFAVAPTEDSEAVLRQAVVDSHIRATLPGHRDFLGRSVGMTGVAFSEDGKHVATTTADGVLQVFDWEAGRVTGEPRRVLRNGHFARSPVFNPADSHHIAFAGGDHVATVWDWTRAGEPGPTLALQEEAVSVAYSSDGERVASGGWYGTIRIRDLTDNNQSRALRGHAGAVNSVDFSPDGTRLVSSGADGTIRVWDLVDGAAPLVLSNRDSEVSDVVFSTDRRHLVSAGADGTVRTWDLGGTVTSTVLGNHDGIVTDVAYNADAHSILSTGVDGTVRIWNAHQHAPPVVLRGHHGIVDSAAFSPDGDTAVSVSFDGTTRIWDIDEVEDVTVLRGPPGRDGSIASRPDRRQVAVGGEDGVVRLWDLTGDRDPLVLPGLGKPIIQVTYSPDGRHLAAVVEDGTILVWNLVERTEPAQLRVPNGAAWQAAFSPDSTRLAATFTDSVWLWDIPRSGPPERGLTDLLAGFHGNLRALAWNPGGHQVAASTDNNTVLIWDLRTDARPEVLRGPRGSIWSLAFSPDGARLASAADDGTINLWDVTTGGAEPIVFRGNQGAGGNMSFSLDGRHLITNGDNAAVRFWKTDGTDEPLVLDGFRAAVQDLVPLGDDRYVSKHDDGTIRIWRCPACGPVAGVLASSDDHLTRELTPEERQAYLPADP